MNCCLLDITSGKSYRLLFSQRFNNGLFIVLSFASYYSGTSCAGDAPYIAIEPSGVCVYDFFDDQPSYAVYSCDASGKHDYLSVLQVCCLTYKFIDTTVINFDELCWQLKIYQTSYSVWNTRSQGYQ
jgi:hypothetical protein